MSHVHASKVRYCSAKQPKDDASVRNLDWNGQSVTGTGLAANTKYFGMGLAAGGGGPYFVYPLNKTARLPSTKYSLQGHTAKVTDSDFHPFQDDIVVTGSLDCTIKLWKIPEGGVLTQNVTNPLLTLEGHSKRILFTTFHPAANNILASACSTLQNEVKVWDINAGEAVCNFAEDFHTQLINDLKWSPSGAMLSTACRDKKVRIFNPRSRASTTAFQVYPSIRPTKLCWLSDSKILTTGFGATGKRELKVWDLRKTDKHTFRCRVDQGTNSLYPVYDKGSNIVLLTNKGATSVGVWEYVPSDDSVIHCSSNSVKHQCRGFAAVPKRGIDILDVEVIRLMWAGPHQVYPLKFQIPRKTKGRFIKEFYPDDFAGEPSMDSKEWISGADKPPVLMSMNPKSFSSAKKKTSSFVVPKSRKELEKELADALAEIKKVETVKKELLAKLKAAGIEPKIVDKSNLPPPPPKAEPAAKVAEPKIEAVAPAPKAKESKPQPKFTLKSEEKPKREKKKKKKKGPLLKKAAKPKTEEESPAKVAEPKMEEGDAATAAAKSEKAEGGDDDYVKVESEDTPSDLVKQITSKLGDLDVGKLKKILELCSGN